MELELDLVPGGEADEVEPDFPGGAGDAAVPVGQLDAVGPVLEDFSDGCLDPDVVAGRHGLKLELRRLN